MLSVTFCGAARTVTGSQYYLQYTAPGGEKFNFCIDSGLFQTGQKVNLYKINSHLLFDPRNLDALILTHAHLDHCGRIPYLVKNGFGGKIHSTLATKQIAEVVMRDAARLNTEVKDNKEKTTSYSPLKGIKKSDTSNQVEKFELDEAYMKILNDHALEKEVLGLYNDEDVNQTMTRFKTYGYHEKFLIHPNLQVEFFDAGHILGSAYLFITELSSGKKVAFSGDFGNLHKPIIQDPEKPVAYPDLTHIFIETTYGNRLHGKLDPKEKLRKVVYQTLRNGGQVILPAFSVERAQEVIYYLVELMQENKIQNVPIYLDSPMASKILTICLEHPELYDDEMKERISTRANPLIYKNLKITETSGESKFLNKMDKPCIIIAGSGMLNGGRILKHLTYHIQNERNTLLMVGYQAVGTLGRQILEGAEEIEVDGRVLQVLAGIEIINEFSAHADQLTLKHWLVDLTHNFSNGHKATVFLMHGEKDASLGFGEEIKGSLGSRLDTYWPRFGETVEMWS